MTDDLLFFCTECFAGSYLFSDNWLYGTEKSSAVECLEFCRLESRCNSLDIYHNSNSCWLNEATFAVAENFYVSEWVTAGPKECGKGCFLGDLDSYDGGVLEEAQWSPTAVECQRRCQKLEGCVSFTFVHHDYELVPANRGSCILKSTGVGSYAYQGYGKITSGLANC